MNAPAQLEALQCWMQRAIAQNEGDDASQHIQASQSQSPADRLAVYQHAYFARLTDCLREMFPAVVQALGRDGFDQFACGYLQRHPPASYTLNKLGDRFD